MNEIYPTIYYKCQSPDDHKIVSSLSILFKINLELAQMPVDDKWYICLN